MIEWITTIQDALPTLIKGAMLTIQITSISLLIALIIGLVIGMCRITKSKILNYIAAIYINVIRGTPLLIQILFVYFGLPMAFDFKISAIVAGIIALSLNNGAYFAEIFRAGIQSIDRGQMEAGRSLGFSYVETMRLIILPQAIRRMIPTFVNQSIIGLKDSSLLSVIGIAELTMQGQSIYSMNFRAFEILTAVAVFYFIMTYLLFKLSQRLERRLN